MVPTGGVGVVAVGIEGSRERGTAVGVEASRELPSSEQIGPQVHPALFPDRLGVVGGEVTVAVLTPPRQRGLEGGDALLPCRAEQRFLVTGCVLDTSLTDGTGQGVEMRRGDLPGRERLPERCELLDQPRALHELSGVTGVESTEQPQPLLRRPRPIEAPPARVDPRTQARRQLHLQGLELIAQADDLGGLLPHRHHVGDLIDLWLRTHVRSVKNFLPLDNPDR
ncbi:MAG: hypothetical protein AAGA17_04125 [Actinomycetota bacterium]